MPRSPRASLGTALLSLLVAASASDAFEGDPQLGRVKASSCLGCHAIASYSNAYPNYHVPKVGGQNPEYIISALLAYRSGTRDHQTMHGNALSLTDQDIADIAAFFSSVDD